MQAIPWRCLFLGLLLTLLVDGRPTRGLFPAAWADSPATDISLVLASIERAWTEGDADAIVERFGPRKVLLRLPGNPHASQRFSHQQNLLILRDHFASNEIRRFNFVRTQSPEAERGKAVALAEVVWQQRGAGRTREGRVLMVLERDVDRWVLTEVQALP